MTIVGIFAALAILAVVIGLDALAWLYSFLTGCGLIAVLVGEAVISRRNRGCSASPAATTSVLPDDQP